jgi:hypothetical protein
MVVVVVAGGIVVAAALVVDTGFSFVDSRSIALTAASGSRAVVVAIGVGHWAALMVVVVVVGGVAVGGVVVIAVALVVDMGFSFMDGGVSCVV